jgi:hypothetical protein
MKVISIAIVRTGSDLNEPIPLSITNDLSTFGFFQRQVNIIYVYYTYIHISISCSLSRSLSSSIG